MRETVNERLRVEINSLKAALHRVLRKHGESVQVTARDMMEPAPLKYVINSDGTEITFSVLDEKAGNP